MSIKIVFAISLILTLGCGIKFGEKNKDANQTAQVKSARCLDDSIAGLKLFVKGEASDKKVEESVLCLKNVFTAFKENIRGQEKESFTSDELSQFIKVNFLKDGTEITKEFQLEIMKLKVVLFGGTEAIIQKSEIDQVVLFMGRLTNSLVKLNPHMKIISMNWDSVEITEGSAIRNSKEGQFLQAKKAFQDFVITFTSELKRNDADYEIDDLINLAVETAKFANSKSDLIKNIKMLKPVVKRFKRSLIGGSDAIKGSEWDRLGLTLGEAYFQMLRVKYFLNPLNDSRNGNPEEVRAKQWQIYKEMAVDVSQLFQKLLLAKQSQSVANAELADIMAPLSEIFPQFQINEDLLSGISDLKVMLLGQGAMGREGWTRADLVNLNKKIPILMKNLSAILKVVNELSSENASQISYGTFNQYEVQLLTAAAEISDLVEAGYDLRSLQQLLENLTKTILKDELTLPANFIHVFNATIAGQTLITGEKTSLLSAKNMQLLMKTGSRAFLNFQEYNMYLAKLSSKDLAFNENSLRLWPKLRKTLTVSLNLKSSHVITTEEIISFIQVLQNEKLIETHFRSDSLSKLLNAVWSHLLNDPGSRISTKMIHSGFNLQTLAQLSNEVEIYLQNQKNISIVFSSNGRIEKGSLIKLLSTKIESSTISSEKIGLTELNQFLQQKIPLNFNELGYLKILTSDVGNYSYQDLAKSNLARALSRMIIRGYAGDADRARDLTGINLAEAELIFSHFRPAAIDLDFLEESNLTFIQSRFRESNLFLSPSNGDQFVNFAEMHQLLLHIFSGTARSSDVKNKIKQECLPQLTTPITSQTPVNEDCLLEVYAKEQAAFQDMPLFLQMKTQYTAEQMKEYYYSLLKAAGHVPNAEKVVYFTDVDLFPHVIQYIEMLYSVYDFNRDGFLRKDEAFAAFPVFKSLLAELVASFKQIKEEDLQGVFIYILKYGRPPKKESIAEVLKFISFIRDKEQKGWDIQSTRLELGKIFNFIADATKPTAPVVPQP